MAFLTITHGNWIPPVGGHQPLNPAAVQSTRQSLFLLLTGAQRAARRKLATRIERTARVDCALCPRVGQTETTLTRESRPLGLVETC